MKTLAFFIFSLSLSCFSMSWAQTYKAPKLEKIQSKTKKVSVKKETWESGYKVQDQFESERGLASEEEKKKMDEGRNPSSRSKKLKTPKARQWRYDRH